MELKPRQVKIIRSTSSLDKKSILRVAAYCRVSTDFENQADSFIAQVKYYNDFIRLSDGMELVDIYADEGITGTSISKRDEFKRMLKDSSLGKIDRIYVKSVTRFARNSLECIESIRQLKSNGTTVYFENDGIDTECMNSEMILYIKSSFAQSEALAGSKRVSTAYKMKMESGTFVTTTAPFGYRLENNKLVIVPDEARVVRKIYDLYLQGMGINKLINELNETEKNYSPWKSGRLQYVLRNEKYIGDSLWRKTFTTGTLPLKKKRNRGEVDQYYSKGTHEAIIDEDTYKKVQQLINQKAEKSHCRVESKNHSFSNVLYCGKCGCSYKLKHPMELRRWVCAKNGLEGRHCYTASVTESEIENTFVRFFNRLKQNEDIIIDRTISQLTALKKQISAGNDDITEIDKEIASLSEENNMYVKLFQQNYIDEITFREQTGVVNKKINEYRIRRQKILHSDDEEMCIEKLRGTKEQLKKMPNALLWYDQKFFNALISKVFVVSKDSLEFELNCGLKLMEKIIWD